MENKHGIIRSVSATELNRGKSSKYLKEVNENNIDLFVIKNSSLYAVILSIERYNELRELEQQVKKVEWNLNV